MNLTDACIRKPVLAWVLMIGVVLIGGVSLQRIGISQFPDVDFPVVNVSLTWEGASAEAVESDILEDVEDTLSSIEGVTAITATARTGSGTVSIEFDISRNIDSALQDVQSKLGQITRRLPKDIDPPVVTKMNPDDFPILWAGLGGNVPRRQLMDTARTVRDRLLRTPGVGDILLGGSAERAVRLWFDNTKLIEQGITVIEVAAALNRQHLEIPAGYLEDAGFRGREINVRVMGEALKLEQLRALVVGGSANRPVRLEDVAQVEDGFVDQRSFSRFNGESAVGIGIRKQRGTNQVAVAKAVRQALIDIQPTLPPGMSIGINYDATVFIERSITDLGHELLLAVALTAVVCWLFLGSLSATSNVILAIPMSLFGTITVLDVCGFTLNTFTLLGLALVIGLVVDDAIMVQENITRHMELGAKPKKAASRGTKEIAFAALAATAAVIAIFMPVLFVPGVIGRFLLQFGVAFSVAVALSYIEAVTLAPARCSQMVHIATAKRGLIVRGCEALFAAIGRLYLPLLNHSLRRPWTTLVIALVLFVSSLWLFTALPKEFISSEDQSRLQLRLDAPASANLEETDALMRQVEAYLLQRQDIERVYASIGGGNFGSSGSSSGNMLITLVQPDRRQLSQQQIQGEIRAWAGSLAGARVVVQDPSAQSFSGQRQGAQIEFSLRGDDWSALIETSREAVQRLRSSGVLVDVDSDYRLGRPEARIEIQRSAAQDLGVKADDVAQTVNFLLSGNRMAKFSDDGRRLDIRARATLAERQRPEDLLQYRVRSASGSLVPLANLAEVQVVPTVQAILRRDRSRAITITANLGEGVTREAANKVIAGISAELPVGIRLVEQGIGKQMRETFSGLGFSLILGLVAAYLILGGQFNSFLHPLTVLTVLPFALSGALAGLWLGGFTFNLFSAIGIVLLMGLAKKNSIILVDYANQGRERGLSTSAAMHQAGLIRLRPIVMTSVATLAAAVPTALGLGAGAETRQPMAVAILGGVFVSTILSLVVVPAFYVLADRLLVKVRGGSAVGEAGGVDRPGQEVAPVLLEKDPSKIVE